MAVDLLVGQLRIVGRGVTRITIIYVVTALGIMLYLLQGDKDKAFIIYQGLEVNFWFIANLGTVILGGLYLLMAVYARAFEAQVEKLRDFLNSCGFTGEKTKDIYRAFGYSGLEKTVDFIWLEGRTGWLHKLLYGTLRFLTKFVAHVGPVAISIVILIIVVTNESWEKSLLALIAGVLVAIIAIIFYGVDYAESFCGHIYRFFNLIRETIRFSDSSFLKEYLKDFLPMNAAVGFGAGILTFIIFVIMSIIHVVNTYVRSFIERTYDPFLLFLIISLVICIILFSGANMVSAVIKARRVSKRNKILYVFKHGEVEEKLNAIVDIPSVFENPEEYKKVFDPIIKTEGDETVRSALNDAYKAIENLVKRRRIARDRMLEREVQRRYGMDYDEYMIRRGKQEKIIRRNTD